MLWEPAHRGAELAADEFGAHIYWNAPMREDDIGEQVEMVERISADKYQGLVLAPDQALALITPVRRATARGIPTVILGSPLPIPPGGKLSYILNDEEERGRIAGRRAAQLLHGRGSVAILGINADISGILARTHSFEKFLAQNYPDIHVVQKLSGSFNMPHEQQVASDTVKSNPELDLIVAMMWSSARGAMSAIDNHPSSHSIKVIGFDPDEMSFTYPTLDSVIVENGPEMGRRAVQLICSQVQGHSVPELSMVQPTLVTRENATSEQVSDLTSMDWRPASMRWKWSAAP